ncbi:hypothetical protein [Phytohabitans rumicis]|nr:hypothetical protein [Phytohabitans rumicis]
MTATLPDGKTAPGKITKVETVVQPAEGRTRRRRRSRSPSR